jgi:ferric-dicitrate binding protein FerR (iron transport regulator)
VIDEELQDWIDKFLNETATDEESRALEKRLLGDAQARDHYLNAMNLHGSLRRRFAVNLESPPVQSTPTKNRWKLVVGLAIAASLALLAGMVALLLPTSPSTATIAQVVGAYRDDGSTYSTGESVEPGPLLVSRGLMRLDFSNGARVTIEGPAELEVINEMRVVLHRGLITATIPKSAVGFVIDTSAAHVVDLGTSFGVSVSEEGLTEVCVFDGKVEVSSPEANRADAAPQLVREGQAIRASEGSKTIDSVAYETTRFENAWPVNSGVLQTTGSMRFVAPGPDFHPGNYEDNEHIVVFPERRGFVSDQVIRVDMVDPGQYAKSKYDEKPTLSSGRRLTSYLLQLNAYPEGINPNRRRSVRGQITFAKPIAGVITMNRLLKESEAVFGIPDVEYPSARTIEPRPEGDQRPGFDSLILAADQRTLLIDLQENPGHLDQVRVLVEAE